MERTSVADSGLWPEDRTDDGLVPAALFDGAGAGWLWRGRTLTHDGRPIRWRGTEQPITAPPPGMARGRVPSVVLIEGADAHVSGWAASAPPDGPVVIHVVYEDSDD